MPWQGARSVSRWSDDKAIKGVARWQSIVREAAKQAHRPWVPRVSAPVSVAGLAARAADARVLVLEPTAATALSAVPVADGAEIVLVVGPEGGIAPDEPRHPRRSRRYAGARAARRGRRRAGRRCRVAAPV
ncbi:RsmE family RNA methyltransferase [Microbacterium sp. B24]|uniref:RsmE family RNA methyltransferase n=1 Tax=Microbacterium sp. B24 TaxID=95616 RepID=UPI0035B50FF9